VGEVIEKYVGAEVEIIYQDSKGSITQRKIRVLSVQNGKIKAICITSGAPRIFLQTNILAVQLINRRAV
jgi:propanediol dehydratase large subunit